MHVAKPRPALPGGATFRSVVVGGALLARPDQAAGFTVLVLAQGRERARVPEFLEPNLHDTFKLALLGGWQMIEVATHRRHASRIDPAMPSRNAGHRANRVHFKALSLVRPHRTADGAMFA